MSYLKILEIADVDEDSVAGAFTRRVNVVEVLDSEGNPWEPAPGPDPWDELVKDVYSGNYSWSTPLAAWHYYQWYYCYLYWW